MKNRFSPCMFRSPRSRMIMYILRIAQWQTEHECCMNVLDAMENIHRLSDQQELNSSTMDTPMKG
jgi:hypothetical protein